MLHKYKLVCFDMDGTLITNTNSVEYLCTLMGRRKEVKDIEDKVDKDEISWIEADYIKARLFKGLEVNRIEEEFSNHIELIRNVEEVLKILKINGLQAILVTAGPIQVAEVLGKQFKFDNVYGSAYEVKNGRFTGNILNHLGDSGKLESLKQYCEVNAIAMNEVVAIGDSASDIKVFENSGRSIAINYSYKLEGRADYYLKTNNLMKILDYII